VRIKHKIFVLFTILVYLVFSQGNLVFAEDNKYPDYAKIYVGEDKFENLNRKVFIFNSKLNKWVIRPANIVWESIMPKYGMDRIQSAYANIEYPKRLVSSLMQKDFSATKNETLRFLTNTTLGLGGLYDPAKRYFKLDPINEDIDKGLAKLHVKEGPYLVVPVLSSTTPRALAGKAIEAALEPTWYFGTPITAIVKAGLFVNKTAYMQPMIEMLESTYADPYDVAKKMYGIENYIKDNNLDRKGVLDTTVKMINPPQDEHTDIAANTEDDHAIITPNPDPHPPMMVEVKPYIPELPESKETKPVASNPGIPALPTPKINVPKGMVGGDSSYLLDVNPQQETDLTPDMILKNYNPQSPVVDSMRTALFDLPGINDSAWMELSVWNRCFSNKIKTSSVAVTPNRDEYHYKYIMQKDKNSPVAILYPSIGEGITSHHSVVLAKLFYDEGYSVIIQGSNFNWEFVKSMPESYRPGIPAQDAECLRTVTSKIVDSLQKKYDCQFRDKVALGTSFGALTTLFLADEESKNNTLGISKFISINPPIELTYALTQLDKNNDEWNKNPDDLKQRVAMAAAKVVQVSQMQESGEQKFETLPFTDEEAKLITSFLMRQKLSDLVFTLENTSKSGKTDVYKQINNMSFRDYAEKYLIGSAYPSFEELHLATSLYSISDYLRNNNNYKIYHTMDDYFVNQQQLKKLKELSSSNIVLLNDGAHLGFLYRQEFIDSLKKDIALNK